MNFYKRHLGAYAKKTAHLSLTEHGAYQVLLDTYYSTGRPLPAAKDELYRIARAMSPGERRAVDRVADEFFPVNGDGSRHNTRADEELTTYGTQAETNRRIAVEREEKRKQHDTSTNRATKRQPNSEVRSQKELKTPLPPSGAFALFWQAWPKNPRKSAQGKCAELWQAQGLDPKAEEILGHVEAMKLSDDWKRGYVPAPLVYLRGARWEGAEPGEQQERFPI